MTFAEQFRQSQGKPIDVDGALVQSIYERSASKGLRIVLRWECSIAAPTQGVSISCKGGTLRVAETTAKDIVLWADTSPAEVLVTCDGSGVKGVSLWNCWRDDRGVTQAWVGNAAMMIQDLRPGVVRMRCNSRPEVTFQDLIFEIQFEPPS